MDKTNIFLAITVIANVLISCEDTSGLKGWINGLGVSVTELEKQVSQMNRTVDCFTGRITIDVHVDTPGTLSSLLSSDQQQYIKALRVTGTLNDLDFSVLKEMGSLRYLDMGELNNKDLPAGMFKENKVLKEVVLPRGLEYIPEYMFYKSGIENCVMGEGIAIIKRSAFAHSHLSGEIELPASLIKTEEAAFLGTPIDKIIFNEGLRTIGFGSFSSCLGLELSFPSTLEKIECYAFSSCRKIGGDLVIPEKVAVIGGWSFSHCRNVKRVYCKNPTPPLLKGSNLQSFPSYNYLGVPVGSKEAYLNQAAQDGWSDRWSNFLVVEEVDFEALGL